MLRIFPVCIAVVLASNASAETVKAQLPTGIAVEMVELPFKNGRHSLSGCDKPGAVCLVDMHYPVGAIDVPMTELKSITVTYRGTSYALDTSNMYNPQLKRRLDKPGEFFTGFCYDPLNCSFRGVFGDAGGAHAAEWHVREGVTYRSVLSESGDLVQYFLEHMMPPKYD